MYAGCCLVGPRYSVSLSVLFAALFASGVALGEPARDSRPSRAAAPSSTQRTESGGIRLAINKQEASNLFGVAAQRWTSSLDLPNLRAAVRDVAAGKAIGPKEQEHLKLVRKDGNILRGSFVLFDKRHESSSELDRYVTKFGKMNDALAAGNKVTAARYAQQVLRSLDNPNLSKAASRFSPASHRSFDQRMGKERASLETSLAKATVRMPEFHDMRKALTKILMIFTLSPSVAKDRTLADFHTKLGALQTKMGEMHDEVTARAMRGELKYDEHEITLPKEMRAEMREILDRLK
jgi:hypothetical protein